MKNLIFAALVALLATSTPSWAEITSANIVGTYSIKGINQDASTYDGNVTVKPDASGGVEVRWEDSVGVGMIKGNMLVVGMVYEKRSVVMVMDILPDGTLKGSWIQRGEPGTGSETWKRKK